MRKHSLQVCFFAAAVMTMVAVAGYGQRDVSKEVLMKLKPEVSKANAQDLMKKYGLEIVREYQGVGNLFLCRVPAGENLEGVMKTIKADVQVEYVEANQEVQAM